jgi:GNAT superfamily N-acetyltransferase
MEYKPARFERETLAEYVALFTHCFPKAPPFTIDYLRWLYCTNPDGMAVGFDAWDGTRLVAHYVCIPGKARVDEREVRSLLSLNSATHAQYQGQGHFTRLAKLTYERGAKEGFDCVYGIANANSTGAFVHKLGFQLVQPLNAHIGFGSLGVDWDAVHRNTRFSRAWSPEGLAWRLDNPRSPVCTAPKPGYVAFSAIANQLVRAYAEMRLPAALPLQSTQANTSLLRICLGLLPEGSARYSSYVNIPLGLRPSPLNFIYLALSDLPLRLEPGSLQVSFLDFDAY